MASGGAPAGDAARSCRALSLRGCAAARRASWRRWRRVSCDPAVSAADRLAEWDAHQARLAASGAREVELLVAAGVDPAALIAAGVDPAALSD